MIKLRLSAQKQVIVLTDMVIGEPEWLTGHSNTSVTVQSVSCGKLRITGKGLKLIHKRWNMKEGLLLLGIEFQLEQGDTTVIKGWLAEFINSLIYMRY